MNQLEQMEAMLEKMGVSQFETCDEQICIPVRELRPLIRYTLAGISFAEAFDAIDGYLGKGSFVPRDLISKRADAVIKKSRAITEMRKVGLIDDESVGTPEPTEKTGH